MRREMRCDVCGGGGQLYCVECLRDRIRHGFRYEFVALAEQSASLHRQAACILDGKQARGRSVISGSRVAALQTRIDAAKQTCTTLSAAIARRRAENQARREELGRWAGFQEEEQQQHRQRGQLEMQQLATAITETSATVGQKRASLLTAVGTVYGLRRRRSRKGDGHDYFLGGVILPSLDSARLHHGAVRWASLQRAADLAALAAYYCSATLPFEIRLTGSGAGGRVVGLTIDGKTCLPSEDFAAYARVAAMLVCDLVHLCRKQRRTAREEAAEAGAGRGEVSIGRLLYCLAYGEAMDCQAITLRGVEATLLQVPVQASYDSEWDLV